MWQDSQPITLIQLYCLRTRVGHEKSIHVAVFHSEALGAPVPHHHVLSLTDRAQSLARDRTRRPGVPNCSRHTSMHSGSSSKPPSSAWKGKQKASDSDYDDLNPIITYRHLHSNNLGVKDPLRVIALCDSDAFYAACEQVRLGLDPSIPLVVQQWDALIAVNYPARKFGISRMDKVKDAKKRCPNLVAVHVATYKEGEKEPGYWDNPDTLTHKVGILRSCSLLGMV